jgi:hypothetical protein
VQEVFTSVSPEVSFNFGTASGWSYLSLGTGVGIIRGDLVSQGVTSESVTTGNRLDIHAGVGARWFTIDHLAIGFDVRLHRLSAGRITPSTMRLAASVGISVH